MAEQINIPDTTDRVALYTALGPQLRALLQGETDAIAAMANLCAAIHPVFGWHWTGFYRVQGGQLVLGPFQGPVACTPIAFGKGVCGTAWSEGRIINVPDVDAFPGHIACSPASRSELVIPVYGRSGAIAAVLDVDSTRPDDFTAADEQALAGLCGLLSPLLP